MSPPPSSVALLRQPLKHAAAAIRNWKPPATVQQPQQGGPLLSFADFRRRIPSALSQKKEFGLGGGSTVDPVWKLFQKLDTAATSRELVKYTYTDPTLRYTRNLIDTDNETYTLLLLCWNPGHESPIHDHPGDGCWVKVMQGVIRECRYRQELGNPQDDTRRLHCYQRVTARQGDVTFMDDSLGYHSVGNPSGSTIATTLHLYSPPIQKCKTWAKPCDVVPKEARMSNYSEFGLKLSETYYDI